MPEVVITINGVSVIIEYGVFEEWDRHMENMVSNEGWRYVYHGTPSIVMVTAGHAAKRLIDDMMVQF